MADSIILAENILTKNNSFIKANSLENVDGITEKIVFDEFNDRIVDPNGLSFNYNMFKKTVTDGSVEIVKCGTFNGIQLEEHNNDFCSIRNQKSLDKKVRVLFPDWVHPPWYFKNKLTGDHAGFSYELLKKVQKEIQAQGNWFEWEECQINGEVKNWSELNNYLGETATEKCDIAISGWDVLEHRSKVLPFTQSYLSAGDVIIVRKMDRTIVKGKYFFVKSFTWDAWLSIIAGVGSHIGFL